MKQNRIEKHPILQILTDERIEFYWNGTAYFAGKGEVISSSLYANDIKIFGHHHKDKSAQGIFCANGQCAKCMVIADGLPVKACMTIIQEGMKVQSVEGLPVLPDNIDLDKKHSHIIALQTEVLIIGGGPAGLSAAIQLGESGINTILIDDKTELGGKLVLQTHKFFGSEEDSFAGTRGNDIGKLLVEKVKGVKNLQLWIGSTALHIFKDKRAGVLHKGKYIIIEPKIILNAAGAREKFLQFKGNTLAGIYGAGAFQTLVNRDLIKPTEKLFIVGGGNVGLIAGYHALQAGIDVVGLAEAMPKCGGYKVHADKLKRLGVPIYTSHTIVQAAGKEIIDSVTISEIDRNFSSIPGTEKHFECDTLLIAVGLESVSEFTEEAELAGIKVFSAGDAGEIAEASSAMFNGKIVGKKIADELLGNIESVPQSWYEKAEILKSEPGLIKEVSVPKEEKGVMPIIHCIQEIPCNPCSTVCPTNSIFMKGDPIMDLPIYEGSCIGCTKCVTICPGLAITLVDYRKDSEFPTVTLPYEVNNIPVNVGDTVRCVDIDGKFIDRFEVTDVKMTPICDRTQLIKLKAPKDVAKKIVSFIIQDEIPQTKKPDVLDETEMVCLCERVTKAEILDLIKAGMRDMNQIKALTRAGMGPCGAKSCDNLIKQIFRQEKIPVSEITENTRRPLFVEVPLGKFSDGGSNE
jgi:sarcosine oxidase, subunit alpha